MKTGNIKLHCLKCNSKELRKTWANTQKLERLQMHIDLFIACQNGYKLKF